MKPLKSKRINLITKRAKIKKKYSYKKFFYEIEIYQIIKSFYIILLLVLLFLIKIFRKKKILVGVDVSKANSYGGGPIQLCRGISRALPYENKDCKFIPLKEINFFNLNKHFNYYYISYPFIKQMHFEKLRENNMVQTLLLGPNYVPVNWKHFPQKKYYREKNFREILLSIKALVVHSQRVRDHLAKKSNTTDLFHKFIFLRACTYSKPNETLSFQERNIDIILYEKYADFNHADQAKDLFNLFKEKNKTIEKLHSGFYRRSHLKNLASKSKFVIYFSFYDTGAIALKEIQNCGVIAFSHQKDLIISNETGYYIPELEDKDIKIAFNKIMEIIDYLSKTNVDSKKIAIINQDTNKCERALDDLCDGLIKNKN